MNPSTNPIDGCFCIFCCLLLVGGVIVAVAKEALNSPAGNKAAESVFSAILGQIFKK